MKNEITLPDFEISANGKISQEFVKNKIYTFHRAIEFICSLPYSRNSNKYDLTTVFSDKCGTCGTKHAILKQLADEHNFTNLQLVIALFKMDGIYSRHLQPTLEKHQLEYIPEAHNYLKYKGRVFDFTRPDSANLGDRLIEEVEITPSQITDHKVEYHKNYLAKWLSQNPHIPYTLEEFWIIREQSIKDLSD